MRRSVLAVLVPCTALLAVSLTSACKEDGSGPGPGDQDQVACADTCLGLPRDDGGAGLIRPSDLIYVGAFRLPAGPNGDERPETFSYGGNAMAYWADGDSLGPDDGYPGSLFITGHDRLAYGELPDGSRLAEVTIPAPATGQLDGLPVAELLQGFYDVTGGLFDGLDEIPRIGLAVLDLPETGPRIHIAWGAHFQEPPQPSHAMIGMDLSDPQPVGAWYVGDATLYAVNGYMLTLPADWADAHANGRRLATGRYRDGGWSGKGPALFAYLPVDGTGTPAAAGTRLDATTLLQYEDSQVDDDPTHGSLDYYQHADEWEGATWLTTPDGRSALVLSGTKAVGYKYWYGFTDPDAPGDVCVEVALVDQFVTCRCSCGGPCPDSDYDGCSSHLDNRGWWSQAFNAQLLFYDPAELAAVADGLADPWTPQPYAAKDLDPVLFLNPAGIEEEILGTGPQRHYRLGPVTFDPDHGLLYVLELFADEAKPVVHVFRVD